MNARDREKVLEHIQDLEGWADYIFAALYGDGRSKPEERKRIERAIEGRSLKRLREFAWSLRDELHRVSTEMAYFSAAEETVA